MAKVFVMAKVPEKDMQTEADIAVEEMLKIFYFYTFRRKISMHIDSFYFI